MTNVNIDFSNCQCGLDNSYNWAGPTGRLCHHSAEAAARRVLQDCLELLEFMDQEHREQLAAAREQEHQEKLAAAAQEDEPHEQLAVILEQELPDPAAPPGPIITPRDLRELSLLDLFRKYRDSGAPAQYWTDHQECVRRDPGFYRAGPALELCYHMGGSRPEAVRRSLERLESKLSPAFVNLETPFEETPMEAMSENYMLDVAGQDDEFYRNRTYGIHLIMSISMFRHIGIIAHALLANHIGEFTAERELGEPAASTHQLTLLRYYAVSINAMTATMILHLNDPDRWGETEPTC